MMTDRTRILARGLTLMLGLGSLALAGQPVPEDSGEKVVLPKGGCVLVMQVKDFLDHGGVAEGSGGAVVQATHNAFMELGLSARSGSYAATANALEQAERLGCAYVARPHLERFDLQRRRKAKVEVTIDLLATGSGAVLASCSRLQADTSSGKARAEELLRPAVEGCLDQIVEVPTRSVPAAGDRTGDTARTHGRLLVMPYTESWIFQPDGTTPIERIVVERALDLLREGGHEALEAPEVENRRQLLASARKEHCDSVLAMGVGILRTSLEPPPPDAGLQIFADRIDVTSGQTLITVFAEAREPIAVATAPATLPVLIEHVLREVLDPSEDTRLAAAIDGVDLSVLEPPAVVQGADVPVPKAARKRRVRGTVVLGFVVDETGRVSEVSVIESVPELDEALIKIVKRSRYTPGRRDGKPCPMYMVARHKFGRD
jgi:TonB family protein